MQTATRISALVLLLCGAAASAASAATHAATETERRSFELVAAAGRPQLLVDNVNGSIVVEAGGAGRVEVEIVKTFEAKSAEALDRIRREAKLTVEQEPGRLALVQDGPFRCDRAENRRRCEQEADRRDDEVTFDWKLTVPRELDLDVRDVNGERIEVHGVAGRVEVEHVNGAVTLTGLEGPTRATTVNGDVAASFAASPAGDLRFTTVNGELDLAFPADFGAELSAHTLNGEVLTDFPFETLAPQPEARRDGGGHYRLEGSTTRIGRGGARLECDTVNGDILIRVRR